MLKTTKYDTRFEFFLYIRCDTNLNVLQNQYLNVLK